MDADLPSPFFPQKGHEGVRVGVTAEQSHLKKEQAGRPDPGATAVPGQDVAGDDRLDLEEQKGAQENDGDKNRHDG